MKLVLSIITAPEGCGMEGQSEEFSESGGTFGRGPANLWILPDPSRHVSTTHGRISFENDTFYIEDTSTNGTYLNEEEYPIGPGNKRELAAGDLLAFGDYTIQVDIIAPPQQPVASDETLGFDFSGQTGSAPRENSFDDLDRWLDPIPGNSPPPVSRPPDSGASTQLLEGTGSEGGIQDPLEALSGPATSKSDPASFSLDDLLSGDSRPTPPRTSSPEIPAGEVSADRMDLPRIPGDDSLFGSAPKKDGDAIPAGPSEAKDDPLAALGMTSPGASMPTAPPTAPTQTFSAVQPPEQPAPGAGRPVPRAPEDRRPPTENQGDDILDSFLATSPGQPSPAPSGVPLSADEPPAAEALNTTSPSRPGVRAEREELPDEPPATTASTEAAPQVTAPQATPVPLTHSPAMAASTAPATPTEGQDSAILGNLGLQTMQPKQREVFPTVISQVVRETVKGLMTALRARNQIKSEFRMNMTMIQAAENNPLKFAVTVEDALEDMFLKTGKAYLPAPDAVADGFADLADHQIALFDAMRAAYESLLTQFDPEYLEARLGPTKKGLLGSKKGQTWENYKKYYAELTEDKEESFKRLFGEVFAEAYEKRMNELKAARK